LKRGEFDSKDKCDWAAQHIPQPSPAVDQYFHGAVSEAIMSSRCVSSDDPRLKGN
jgi:hypothetical protein